MWRHGSTDSIPATSHLSTPKGWKSELAWLADGLPTIVVTHQQQVKRRTGKVCRLETDVLPLCHATNSFIVVKYVKICVLFFKYKVRFVRLEELYCVLSYSSIYKALKYGACHREITQFYTFIYGGQWQKSAAAVWEGT